MSINNLNQKIKSLIIILIVLLIGFGSFGLGRLSVTEERGEEPIIIKDAPATINQPAAVQITQNGSFVASKNGSKYYTLSCSGASRIKEENKIYFETKEAAEAAGYDPSSTCKEF